MKQLIIIIAVALLTAPAFAAEEAAPSIGPLQKNYQTVIRGYMSMPGHLLDPFSAQYRFDAPRKAYVQDGVFVGHKRHFGWLVPTWINAKNAFGGYTGPHLHMMFLYEGKVADETDMFSDGMGHLL